MCKVFHLNKLVWGPSAEHWLFFQLWTRLSEIYSMHLCNLPDRSVGFFHISSVCNTPASRLMWLYSWPFGLLHPRSLLHQPRCTIYSWRRPNTSKWGFRRICYTISKGGLVSYVMKWVYSEWRIVMYIFQLLSTDCYIQKSPQTWNRNACWHAWTHFDTSGPEWSFICNLLEKVFVILVVTSG